MFFGVDLSLNSRKPKACDIVNSLTSLSSWEAQKEVVFCGMGEPLLRYDCAIEVCQAIREMKGHKVKIRMDTSGLFWSCNKRLEVLDWIDILSVSLNAENARKYE